MPDIIKNSSPKLKTSIIVMLGFLIGALVLVVVPRVGLGQSGDITATVGGVTTGEGEDAEEAINRCKDEAVEEFEKQCKARKCDEKTKPNCPNDGVARCFFESNTESPTHKGSPVVSEENKKKVESFEKIIKRNEGEIEKLQNSLDTGKAPGLGGKLKDMTEYTKKKYENKKGKLEATNKRLRDGIAMLGEGAQCTVKGFCNVIWSCEPVEAEEGALKQPERLEAPVFEGVSRKQPSLKEYVAAGVPVVLPLDIATLRVFDSINRLIASFFGGDIVNLLGIANYVLSSDGTLKIVFTDDTTETYVSRVSREVGRPAVSQPTPATKPSPAGIQLPSGISPFTPTPPYEGGGGFVAPIRIKAPSVFSPSDGGLGGGGLPGGGLRIGGLQF